MTTQDESKIDFSPALLSFLIIILIISATASWFSPHYAHWGEIDKCQMLEGTVVDKGWASKSCLGEFCYYDYYVVVQDEDGENYTIHVSPVIFTSHTIGGRFNSFYC